MMRALLARLLLSMADRVGQALDVDIDDDEPRLLTDIRLISWGPTTSPLPGLTNGDPT